MANDAAHPEPRPSLEPLHEAGVPVSGPPVDWFVLLDRIEQEVRQLEEHRQAWRNFLGASGVSAGSGEEPAWLANLYFRSQALGIRRMVDGDRRAGSFKRLLHKMTEDCVRLTLCWFVESATAGADPATAEKGDDVSGPASGHAGDATGGVPAEDPDAQFIRVADPWRSGHLDSEVPREDLRTLESSCNGVKRYVDQYVTHAQLDPDATAPDAADIDAAIDILLSLLAKYTLLLRPGNPGTAPADSVV